MLVTGASGGIGAAVLPPLVARGARVLAAGRDPAATDRAVAAAEAAGAGAAGRASAAGGADAAGRADTAGRADAATGREMTAGSAVPLVADLSTPDGPAELAAQALAVHGRVDAVVHVAGAGWRGSLTEMPPATVDALLTLNLRAPLLLTRALLPAMVDRGRGRVVLVASIAGLTGVASESVYAATKAGIITFAESLRLELAGSGVGVSVVSPGAVSTEFFARRGTPYDRGIPRPLPPDRGARAIMVGLEQDRDDAVVPRWLGIAPRVRALAPATYRRLARRLG